MYLVAGLGNPGSHYQGTRHNLGFMLVDRLAARAGAGFEESMDRTLLCRVQMAGKQVVLAKPQTFMNRSGPAVLRVAERQGVARPETLIVFDDIAIPLGRIRLRASGGSGGHKGMASILESFATQDLPRLRIGVGGGGTTPDLSAFVLERFEADEQDLVEEVLKLAESAAETFVRDGISEAMTLYNSRVADEPSK